MPRNENKRIDYSRKFLKQFKKAPIDINIEFRNRFLIFKKNPYHSTLNNHKLTGKFKGLRSINITGDWRAIYTETDDAIIFELLGTHSQLYK